MVVAIVVSCVVEIIICSIVVGIVSAVNSIRGLACPSAVVASTIARVTKGVVGKSSVVDATAN